MLRVSSLWFVARGWSVYFLYFVAVGVAAGLCAQTGARLTKKFAAVTAQVAENNPRPLSRVERYVRDRARDASRIIPAQPEAQIFNLHRPAMHPADMAAAMDRVESSDIPVTVASCRAPACSDTRVRGWFKSAKAKSLPKVRTAVLDTSLRSKSGKPGRRAAVNLKLASVKTQPQTGKLGLKLALTGKMALLPKGQAGDQTQSAPQANNQDHSGRLAKTPGDIIRISLLGNSDLR